MSSEYDSKEVCLDGADEKVSMRVIKTVDQVLPYCVINIKQNKSSLPVGGSGPNLAGHNWLQNKPSNLFLTSQPPGPPLSHLNIYKNQKPTSSCVWNNQSIPPPTTFHARSMSIPMGPRFVPLAAPAPAPGPTPPPAHQINTKSTAHQIFNCYPAVYPPPTPTPTQGLSSMMTVAPAIPGYLKPTATQKASSSSVTSGSKVILSTTFISSGVGGVTDVPVPSDGGGVGGVNVVPVPSDGGLQSACLPGSGLSEEKRRDMKERMKRLTKGVKKLEEQLASSSVDINNFTKLKKLLEIVRQVEKNKDLDFDEILIQKCEKAVKKFLQKSQC